MINKINKMAKSVPVDDPGKCANAKAWDSMTIQSYALVFSILVFIHIGAINQSYALVFSIPIIYSY